MDPPFSEFPYSNDQALLPDVLTEYPSSNPFEDLSFLNPNPSNSAQSSGNSTEGDGSDFSDSMLKYINQVLMEEDVESTPSMFHHPLALHTTEESLYEVIGGGEYPTSQDQSPVSIDQNMYVNGMVGSYRDEGIVPEVVSKNELVAQFYRGAEEGSKFLPKCQLISAEGNNTYAEANRKGGDVVATAQKNGSEQLLAGSRRKKNHQGEDIDLEDGRSRRQSVVYMDNEEGDLSEVFENVVISKPIESKDNQACKNGANNGLQQDEQPVTMGNGKHRGKNRANKKKVIDLRALLILCAEAVSVDDRETAGELLKQIRQQSSPFGDGDQRLAHCFANALGARLAGTGSQIYADLTNRRRTAADMLKFYKYYISVSPFMKMLMIFGNQMIFKAAEKAETLHIIDFGILYGFQWPALIHSLSRRPGGPPKLRITGVELPSVGFRPEERVQETGHRLANYCKRFNVPFEYQAITKKWETIRFDDLKVQRNEVLAVNCLCRLKYLLDETVLVSSPRDTVLNLIRRLNPDIFVHSIINGSHHAPFFASRFREALFHFSAMFDMLENNLPRDDQMRLGFEEGFMGREVLNIVACEGSQRIVRPETYKQWQMRNMRAGFRQLPLDHEVLNAIKDKVSTGYGPEFVVVEDGHWMLQGWKGRIMYGSACWEPLRT